MLKNSIFRMLINMIVNNFLSILVGFLLGILFIISNSKIKKVTLLRKKKVRNDRVMAIRNSEKNKKMKGIKNKSTNNMNLNLLWFCLKIGLVNVFYYNI